METAKGKKGGRKPNAGKQNFIIAIRLTAEEHEKLLGLAEELGQSNRSKFIRNRIFSKEISVVKIDSSLYKVIEWLTKIHSQYRAIGTNYNQTVKHINTCFGEKKAVVLLKNLENRTKNLIAISAQIAAVAEKLKGKYYDTKDTQE
jgi:hypothetical protein